MKLDYDEHRVRLTQFVTPLSSGIISKSLDSRSPRFIHFIKFLFAMIKKSKICYSR